MLACKIYPMPKGTEYTELDLKNPCKVVELFEYCGILEGLITKEEFDLKKAEIMGTPISVEKYDSSAKFCSNCGNPIDSDCKFCPNCGYQL